MQSAQRLPRFEKRPDAIPGFVLTERDILILLIVARMRFVTSFALTALLLAKDPTTSEQKVLRRLQLLFHADYLDRPLRQLDPYALGQGTRPFTYMLGRKGINLLAEKYNFKRASADWTKKARTTTRGTLEHAVDVSEILIAFAIACERSKQFQMVYFDEIMKELAPPETRNNPKPYSWPVTVRWKNIQTEIYVIPDKLFGIRDVNRPSGQNTKYFMLEADRSQMPVVRKDLVQSSVVRKIIGYAATYDRAVHRKMYGLSNFRVLFVTTGRQRIKTVIDTHRQHTRALLSPRLMLMADRKALLSAEDFFAYPWMDLAGEKRRLLD